MATKEITDQNFKELVLNSEKPVLVDFWATWCGPCRTIAPIVDEIADELSDQAVVGKMNVDENSDIPVEYGIRSIPCLLFFKDGKVEKQVVGAVDKSEIASILENL